MLKLIITLSLNLDYYTSWDHVDNDCPFFVGLPLRATGIALNSDGSLADLVEGSGSDEEGLVIPLSKNSEDL